MDPKTEKKLAKQKAREEMLQKIRKDTLEREAAMDAETLKKIKDRWFDSIVETKVPQMQDNLKHILHYMEKLIESESYRKLLFENERQELEEETTLLAQSQSSALQTLFDIYQKRVQDLHSAYTDTVLSKKKEAQKEFNEIEERAQVTQEAMQAMLFQMQEDRDKEEEIMNCSMFLKLDDERSKNTEIKENLRTRLEKKMEKRWGDISAVLNKYEQNTQGRRKEYMALKTKDDVDSKIIYQQMKKTQKLFEQLDELKRCLDDCYAPKETIALIRDTREERTKFFKTFKQLKLILKDEMKLDEINLKFLTVITNSVTKEMKEICTKGEHILTMYRICQRLETEEEKVLPVGDTNLPKMALAPDTKKKGKPKEVPKEVEKEPEQPVQQFSSQIQTENWTKDIEVLEKFWKKVGKARLSKMALKKCISNLENENKCLKNILTSYLREVSKANRKLL